MVSPAAAQGRLQGEVQGGTLKPIPIAIPEFLGDDPRFALEVSNIVAADLERSGLFQPLDRASFIDQVRDMNAPPRFPDWRALNAQALVVGRAFRGPDGRLVAETRVWDVFSGAPARPASASRSRPTTGAASATSLPTSSTRS